MKQVLYEVLVDGTIREVGTYVNNETPRYNLQTFLMEKLHNCHNWWDGVVRDKVDKCIIEREHYVSYEATDGKIYHIRKLSDEQETARKICKLLNPYDIKCEVGERTDRPEHILRASWYVDKLVELGYEKCLYIDLKSKDGSSIGFFAVLDGGKIMSGSNVMIADAFTMLGIELGADDCEVIDYLIASDFERYAEDELSGEDGCIICPSYDHLREFIKGIS